MSIKWEQATVQQHINDQIQESLTLEYKAAAGLGKSDGKKKEITKDVSAMANSAGGILFYGVAEHKEKDKKPLPEKIDPVDQTVCSREWLEQVISNIQPRIEGLVITPVPISTDPNHVVYVLEIPQSTTAHQAKDWRYYKRYNFHSEPMEDYEIRDVMNRQTRPDVQVEFRANRVDGNRQWRRFSLDTLVTNRGQSVVNNFKLELLFPNLDELRRHFRWTPPPTRSANTVSSNLVELKLVDERAVTLGKTSGYHRVTFRSQGVLFPGDEENMNNGCQLAYLIVSDMYIARFQIPPLKWTLYADDMVRRCGEVPFSELMADF
jgi:hypothetical protein